MFITYTSIWSIMKRAHKSSFIMIYGAEGATLTNLYRPYYKKDASFRRINAGY